MRSWGGQKNVCAGVAVRFTPFQGPSPRRKSGKGGSNQESTLPGAPAGVARGHGAGLFTVGGALASRHCTFRPSVGPNVVWLCQRSPWMTCPVAIPQNPRGSDGSVPSTILDST